MCARRRAISAASDADADAEPDVSLGEGRSIWVQGGESRGGRTHRFTASSGLCGDLWTTPIPLVLLRRVEESEPGEEVVFCVLWFSRQSR